MPSTRGLVERLVVEVNVTICVPAPFLKQRVGLGRYRFPDIVAVVGKFHCSYRTWMAAHSDEDGIEPTFFLLSKAEYVLIDPVFEAESERPSLGCCWCRRRVTFQNPRATVIDDVDQPVGKVAFNLDD